MITNLLWSLIAMQIALGAFDTLYHHEMTERLAWRPSQRRELKLHGVRNLLYAALFVALGWAEVHGAVAAAAIAVLGVELVITLWDFVEEDLTRKLPATERVTHTLLALNYGAILMLLVPVLLGWAAADTEVVAAYHGWWSWLAAGAALGVALFGMRDLFASARVARLAPKPAGALVMALPRHRTILVTGATGFVGSRLVEGLSAAGHDVIVLTRDAAKATALRPPFRLITDLEQIDGGTRIDAIVNLAGEAVSGGLWTARRRHAIIESRTAMTGALARLIARLETRPEVFVAASAVGWYGLRGDEMLGEDAAPADCFSHASCAAVEREAARIGALGVRVVALRIGLVLGTEGGLLARLLLPFEFGAGGPVGSGAQWMSWIARDDLVRLIAHAVATPGLAGPVNATAPEPVRNRDFGRALGAALGRPAVMPLPAWPLRMVGGDFAKELLLGGQRVLPVAALASGFAFQHPRLEGALASMLGARVGEAHVARAEAAHRWGMG
ncbi:MAG: TIGR01777 family oxidoreductase [Rhizomicrobium sp.]